MRRFKDAQIETLLHKFKNVQSLHKIERIPVRHENTEHVTCESFAQILKSIYDSHFDHFAHDTAQIRSIRHFSMQEFSNALRNMSLNKAADQDNVVLEIVRFGSRELHKRILKEYNRMISAGIFEESWYCTIFRMLAKSGDLSDASNWRPIAILSILYKIFSKMIYTRINGILNFHQSDEQIGFRSGFRIEDAFLVFASIFGMSRHRHRHRHKHRHSPVESGMIYLYWKNVTSTEVNCWDEPGVEC